MAVNVNTLPPISKTDSCASLGVGVRKIDKERKSDAPAVVANTPKNIEKIKSEGNCWRRIRKEEKAER